MVKAAIYIIKRPGRARPTILNPWIDYLVGDGVPVVPGEGLPATVVAALVVPATVVAGAAVRAAVVPAA